jgi:hypothetical protein
MDPATGRFVSSDPLGLAGSGVNTYAYVANNPINASDPSGLCQDPGGSGIRYCINAFIPQSTVMGFQGDNRGFDPNGGSYRVDLNITQGSDGAATFTYRIADSHPEIGGHVGQGIKGIGTCTASVSAMRISGREINASCTAANGYTFGMGPPIHFDLTIWETETGVSVSTGSGTKSFPSLEVWQYGAGCDPRLIYALDASHGHVRSLLKNWLLPLVPIPLPRDLF